MAKAIKKNKTLAQQSSASSSLSQMNIDKEVEDLKLNLLVSTLSGIMRTKSAVNLEHLVLKILGDRSGAPSAPFYPHLLRVDDMSMLDKAKELGWTKVVSLWQAIAEQQILSANTPEIEPSSKTGSSHSKKSL